MWASGQLASRLLISLLVTALALTSCAGDRPDLAAWQEEWIRVLAIIPAESTIGAEPPQETCQEVLGSLRSSKDELFPTPDPAIDETVNRWLEHAESAFFECPPTSQAIDGFADAYAELRRLQDEVDAAMGIDGAG